MNCFFCKGNTENNTTNYLVSSKDCIIVIKGVPCNKCTQCGEVYYDDAVVDRLDEITSQLKNAVAEIIVVEYHKKVA